MVKKKKSNLYDFILVVLIVSIIFDDILPVVLRPSTLIAFLFPIYSMAIRGRSVKSNNLALIFTLFLYSVVVLVWSPCMEESFKFTILIQPINFLILISIFIAGSYANSPINSLSKGWVLFFIISCITSLYEITFDHHLPSSLQQSGEFVKDGDFLLIRRFASFTYGNYNTFVTVISMALPILFSSLVFSKNSVEKLKYVILLFVVSYILIINGSRGGILCFLINLFYYIYYSKIISFRSILVLLIIIGCFGLLLSNINLDFILFRLASGQLFGGSTRFEIFEICVKIVQDYLFLGTGVGSMNYMLKSYGAPIPAAHNLLMEFILEYGMVMFTLVLVSFGISLKKYKTLNKHSKYIVFITLITLPIYSVINSVYLVYSFVWVWLGTVIILFNVKETTYE